jgi:hypothetical protein
MMRKISMISTVAAAGGALAVGLASGASAATAASPGTPSWHTVLSVPNTGNQFFSSVVATGKTSGWAFSNTGTAYERTGATSWKKVAFPSAGGEVVTAAASSPSNVWAVFQTAGHGSRLDHWNGRSWTVAKSFTGTVTDVSVLGSSDVWAFGGYGTSGDNGVSHFNGRTWARLSATLQGGYAASDRNVWAFSGAVAEHFDGRKWTATNLARLFPAAPKGSAAKPGLTGILALASNNVYAAGDGSDPFGGPLTLLHFNGRSWSRVAAASGIRSNPGQQLVSDGQGGLWIPAVPAGPAPMGGISNELLRYSGGKLSVVAGKVLTSASRIPGTASALFGGVQYGAHNSSVVLQYS